MARLIVMLARAIFSSCWGICACVDTRLCDRTCLQVWTEYILQYSNVTKTQLEQNNFLKGIAGQFKGLESGHNLFPFLLEISK